MFMTLLVRNALYMDASTGWIPKRGPLLLDDEGTVLVESGYADSSDHVVDGKGRLFIPAFANCHTHLPMTLLRGLAEDAVLEDWLPSLVYPLESVMTQADVRVGALLGALETILGGSDRVISSYFYPEETHTALKESGLKGLTGITISDTGNPWAKNASEALKKAEHLLKSDPSSYCLAPHSIYNCSDETLTATTELARKYGTKLTMHASETRWECVWSWEKYKLWPIEHLEDMGVLGPDTIIAHSSWLTKMEINSLKRTGSSVVHCATSNMKLASGAVMPLVELLENTVPIALGTDSPASNNSLSIADEIKFAALVHKAHRWDAAAVKASQILELASGRDIFPRHGVVSFRLDDIRMRPAIDNAFQNHIVYSTPRPYDLLTTDGALMEGGIVRTLDTDKVLEEFDRVVTSIIDRSGSGA